MNIRKFQEADADEVSALIVTTLRTTNIKDYSFEYIENDVKILQPYNILERARWTHFYVACDDNKIVGCGAIGPYWDKENESSLFTIFVLPEYQGRGIGRKTPAGTLRQAFPVRVCACTQLNPEKGQEAY